jgi:hypothetical protein
MMKDDQTTDGDHVTIVAAVPIRDPTQSDG